MLKVSFVVLAGLLVVSSGVTAGPVFDDYLNTTVIDQTSAVGMEQKEGIVLAAEGKVKLEYLSKEKPIGQTFRLGPQADQLMRIFVGISHWPDSWQKDEAVTFTLWDSPAKTKKFYTKTTEFINKSFKWDTAYDLYLPTKPSASYYFELTHNGGGDNRIGITYFDSSTYDQGEMWAAGQADPGRDLVFTVMTKPKGDRVQNLKRFLEKFDYARPELAEAKTAYDKGELDKACSEIVKAFDNLLKSSEWVWRPKPGGKPDPITVSVIEENRLYASEPDKKGAWIRMDRETTWREAWLETTECPRPNDLFARLGQAYKMTGDERYAKKLGGLMLDFANDNTSPFDGGMRGFRWVAMHQAWRLGDAWSGWANAVESKGLVEDVKLVWIDYWHQMAVFAKTEPSGGNHANAVGDSLMSFAKNFPYFKESKNWFKDAYDKLVSNSLKTFRPDGGLNEPAMNYHGFALANLKSGLKTGQEFGFEPSPEIMDVVKRACIYTAYMLMPDGQPPTIGDTDCQDWRADTKKWDGWRKGEVMHGYNLTGRKDLLYIATAGKEGERPAENSTIFPDNRHYILRSGWGQPGGEGFEDERWLFLRGGSMGSHGHWDMNQVVLYAYGRPIIFDPGRTDYHNQPLMRALTSSASHSVLLVDGKEMHRQPVHLNAFKTSPVTDFVDNYYESLYPGVSHRRAVMMIRPNYYLMFDRALAENPEKMGLNFILVPPALNVDQSKVSVNTTDPKGANVLIVSAGNSPITIATRNITTDLGGIRNDVNAATFWQNGIKDGAWVTALYPYRKGETPPAVTVAYDAAIQGGIAKNKRFNFRCVSPDGIDTGFYTMIDADQPGKPGSASVGLIRLTDDGNQVRSFALFNEKSLANGSSKLAEAGENVDVLSVEYEADKVIVTCEKPAAGLAIATQGRKSAVVNGKEMNISGDTFKPF